MQEEVQEGLQCSSAESVVWVCAGVESAPSSVIAEMLVGVVLNNKLGYIAAAHAVLHSVRAQLHTAAAWCMLSFQILCCDEVATPALVDQQQVRGLTTA